MEETEERAESVCVIDRGVRSRLVTSGEAVVRIDMPGKNGSSLSIDTCEILLVGSTTFRCVGGIGNWKLVKEISEIELGIKGDLSSFSGRVIFTDPSSSATTTTPPPFPSLDVTKSLPPHSRRSDRPLLPGITPLSPPPTQIPSNSFTNPSFQKLTDDNCLFVRDKPLPSSDGGERLRESSVEVVRCVGVESLSSREDEAVGVVPNRIVEHDAYEDKPVHSSTRDGVGVVNVRMGVGVAGNGIPTGAGF